MGQLKIGLRTTHPPTPPVGYIYKYWIGSTEYYKTEDGIEHALGETMTLEQVQDLLATSFQDTSSINFTYDDVGNVFTADVIQTALDHTNLQNNGANTHAQIDSHLSSTSNPHSVTKSQVGLANVDNTSDVNKPISTATQVALNAKYDASNPNGYETPAQLNTRDTNNRNRANHTGTQLASTISDFASTVLATVLTGISFATSSAILATDTILIALGKLQAQLNSHFGSGGSSHSDATTSVSGFMSALDKTKLDGISNDVFARSVTQYNNSSNATYVTCSELAVNCIAGRMYKIKWDIRHTSSATNIGFRPGLGGTATGTLNFIGEVAQSATASTTNKFSGPLSAYNTNIPATSSAGAQPTVAEIEGIFLCTANGTIYPQFLSETNGSQVSVLADSLCVYKEIV